VAAAEALLILSVNKPGPEIEWKYLILNNPKSVGAAIAHQLKSENICLYFRTTAPCGFL
jgi:hypothetical protein